MKDEKQVRAARKAETIASVYNDETNSSLYNQRQKQLVSRIVSLLIELANDLKE